MADFAPRDNEERALLCLIAPHVIKLHSSAQPGEGGGSVTLQSSIVKTGQSDGACCCRLSLVTWAWCLLHEERATLMPATVSQIYWVVMYEDERRNSESHTHLSKISTWDEEAACHGPEDCVRRREDLSFTFSPQRETGWLLLWNFIAAPAANISLWFKEKMSSPPEVKKACSSSSPD